MLDFSSCVYFHFVNRLEVVWGCLNVNFRSFQLLEAAEATGSLVIGVMMRAPSGLCSTRIIIKHRLESKKQTVQQHVDMHLSCLIVIGQGNRIKIFFTEVSDWDSSLYVLITK